MKIFKSKKGSDDNVVFGPLFQIVAVAATALVLLIFGVKFLGSLEGESDMLVCKNQLFLQSASMKFSEDIVQPNCKTYNIKFSENEVEKNSDNLKVYDSEKEKYVKEFDSLNNDIVNQVVAEELRDCWDEHWEGKRSIIHSSWTVFDNPPNSCFICSEFYFDASVKSNEFTGFYEFTKEKYMRNSELTYYSYYAEQPRLSIKHKDFDVYDRNSSLNHWEEYANGRPNVIREFLAQFGIEYSQSRPPIVKDITFNKNKLYSVYFVKEGYSRSGAGNDQVKNGVVPDSSETYFAYVSDSSDLPAQCTVISKGVLE